ncbi:MAG: Fe-S cluster assembly protein SufD [Gemmatimonadetes bacterium]|nr:Fe-S cluster assembly protein SufD [Gemmatimonadota bacterium]
MATDFISFARELSEPEALTAERTRAWKRYSDVPFPTKRSEEWRYTDLAEVDFGAFSAVSPAALPDDDLPTEVRRVLARSGERSGIVVQRDGRVVHVELDEKLAEAGVVLCSLAEAIDSHEELLQRALFSTTPTEAEEKLWTLHLAFLTGGYLLYVPKDVELGAPVHCFRTIEGPGTLTATHSLVYAETGGRAAVIDEFLSPELDGESLSLHGATVHGDASSSVEYVALQRFGRGVKHFSTQRVAAQRDARLVTFNVALGGALSRCEVSSRLLGPGSDSEMLALWFGDGDQHFDHHTLQHHAAPNARSDLLFKGALTDEASSVFRGVIRVDVGAQLTDAYQTNRNLLLSEGSNATALPNLEIEADDVRCSHGATIGQVEEGQMFYLMSRGLTRRQAERLLVFGFFDEVLERLPMEGVRARVRETIEEKIGL